MNDLLDMNFNEPANDNTGGATGDKEVPMVNQQQDVDLLGDMFAKFGVDLNQDPKNEPDQQQSKDDTDKKDGLAVQLPDFNTSKNKVKNILLQVPDYSYLFAED